MTLSPRIKAALGSSLVLSLFALALVLVMVLANTQDWFGSITAQRSAARTALLMVVFAGVFSVALLSLLVWLLFLDLAHGEQPSPLLWPVLTVKGALAALLVFTAIGALDRLVHHLALGWHVTDEPEVILVANALYLWLLGGLASFLAVVMRRRGWTWTTILVLFGAMVGAGALAVGAAIWLA